MMDLPDYLRQTKGIVFNQQQKEALGRVEGTTLLLAVPGAGKTTVMVTRLANMILNHHVPPNRILTFTFSRASTQDMEQRFESLFGELISNKPQFQTIHRFCNAVLQEYSRIKGRRFLLIEGANATVHKMTLLRRIYGQINNEYLQEDVAQELTTAISYIKNRMIPDSELAQYGKELPHFKEIFMQYRDVKKENAYMDFDDMLCHTHTILLRYPKLAELFAGMQDYIHVDEAQDNSKVQHEIIRLLSKPHGNLFMVGDEDQSVYAFRGAYPQGLLDFSKDYPQGVILKMEENFRSTGALVEKANGFILHNKNRYSKNMFTHRPIGLPPRVVALDDLAKQYPKVMQLLKEGTGTTAIIYRNNYSAIPLIDLLDREGMGFVIREHKSSFKQSYAIGDVLAFLALSYNGNDLSAFRRIAYKTNCYIKRNWIYGLEPDTSHDTLLKKLVDIADEESGISTARILYANRQICLLKEKSPSKALHTILYDLGYLDFLQSCSAGQMFAQHSQKLQALQTVAEHCATIPMLLDRLDRIESLIDTNTQQGQAPITLTTAHSAKGLEFDRVILIDLTDTVFPCLAAVEESIQQKPPVLMEEEARLFYVSATRAKEELILLYAEHAMGSSILPSRFVRRLLTGKVEEKRKVVKIRD